MIQVGWTWKQALAFLVVMALISMPGLCLIARWFGCTFCDA